MMLCEDGDEEGINGKLGTLQTGRLTEDFCAVDAVFERYRMDNRLVGEFLRGALLAFAQGTLDLALGDNSARRRERDLSRRTYLIEPDAAECDARFSHPYLGRRGGPTESLPNAFGRLFGIYDVAVPHSL